MVVYECPPLVIPNNKNVTFLMGNRCKMMMIAKLLTCRVLFKKYNGPYHLLLRTFVVPSTFCIKNTTCTSSLLHLLRLFFLLILRLVMMKGLRALSPGSGSTF